MIREKAKGTYLKTNKVGLKREKNGTIKQRVKINFPFYNIGTPVFIYQSGRDIFFTDNEIKDEKDSLLFKRSVVSVVNVGTVNMLNLVTEATYFSIYEFSDGYLLSKATEEEIENFSKKVHSSYSSGYVQKGIDFNIGIHKADLKKIGINNNLIAVDLFFGKTEYIKISRVNPDESLPKWDDVHDEVLNKVLHIRYKTEIKDSKMYLGREIAERYKIKKGETLENADIITKIHDNIPENDATLRDKIQESSDKIITNYLLEIENLLKELV